MRKAFGSWLRLVVLVSLAAFVVSCFSSAGFAAEKSRHVLIITVDGAMPAAVKVAKTPNIDALVKDGAVTWDGFAGGVLGTPTRQNTASLSSYNSILTGVWANKHQVYTYRRAKPNHAQYPCFFKRVKEHKKDAHCSSIVNWQPINDRMAPEADHKAKGANDAKVVELAAKHLQEANPDVLFIQLDEVDGAGHGNGYSPKVPKYVEAIERADKYVGDIVTAVKNRKTYAQEDWLIIVLSDHGGKDKAAGGGHGGDTPGERTVFIIVSGEQAKKGAVVSPGPGIVAVVPTALHFLGVKIDPAWGLEAEPFGLKDDAPVPEIRPSE